MLAFLIAVDAVFQACHSQLQFPVPGSDPYQARHCGAARRVAFPVFYHLEKKSAYADDTWVIKINNDRLLLMFSQRKTPGAVLL